MQEYKNLHMFKVHEVPRINQEEIRPDGQWMFRFIGERKWRVDPTGRPEGGKYGCRLRWKRGRFYVYVNTFTRTEHSYRY